MHLKKAWTLTAGLLVLTDACATPLAVKSDSSIKWHMQNVTIPASNGVFAAANESPQNDAQWNAVIAKASALADSGVWLQIHDPTGKQRIWRQSAQNMVKAANLTLQAAKKANAEKVSEAGDALYNACETCHATYLKKQISSNN